MLVGWFFFFFPFKTLGRSVNHFFFKRGESVVCTRMFCPNRMGEIPEVCFMHIKRAECGKTTWGLHFMQKQQCNENNR